MNRLQDGHVELKSTAYGSLYPSMPKILQLDSIFVPEYPVR